MKNNYLLLALLISSLFSVQAWSYEKISGLFDCKIKYQKILVMNEGIPREYLNFKGITGVGRSFEIKYEYVNLVNTKSIVFFSDTDDPFIHSNGWYIELKNEEDLNFFNTNIGDSKSPYIILDKNEDFIQLKQSLYSEDQDLYLSRYYKNDWSGVYAFVLENQVHTMGLGCRHTDDKLGQIIDDLNTSDSSKND